MCPLAALSNFIKDKSVALVANSSLLMRKQKQIDSNDIVLDSIRSAFHVNTQEKELTFIAST